MRRNMESRLILISTHLRLVPTQQKEREIAIEMINSNIQMEPWLLRPKFVFMGSRFYISVQLREGPIILGNSNQV